MTIRLLAAYGIYPCNAIVTLDSPTEAGLIAAKQALADTTGGTPYVAPVLPEAIDETKSGSAGTDSNGNVLTPALSSHNPLTWGIENLVVAGIKTSRHYAANPSNSLGLKINASRSTVTFDNTTMQLQVAVPCGFDQVKIITENIHTSAYNTYFAVAASETAADFAHSVIGGSQKTSAGDWAHVTKAAAEPIASALGSANNPTFTESDWVACKSVDRTDVIGGYPLLLVRAFTPAATGTITRYGNIGSTVEGASTQEANWESLTARLWRIRYKTGDCITTPANFSSPSGPPNFCSPAFFPIVRTRGYGLSVAVVGDSLGEGVYANGLSAGFYSYGHQAVELAHSVQYPMSYICQAWNGQTSANYLINAKAMALAMSPNVLVFPVWSANDGATQAAFDAAFARTMDMVGFCRTNRIVPVLTTIWPKTGNGALGTEYNAKALALRNSGMLVLDVDGIVGSGDIGSRVYAAQYASGDGTHMNAAGHTAVATELAKILVQIRSSAFI